MSLAPVPGAAALALCLTLYAGSNTGAASEKTAGSELGDVRARLEAVAAEIARDRRARDAESERLRMAEAELARTRGALGRVDEELAKLASRVERLRAKRAGIAQRLHADGEALAASARVAYAVAQRDPLELLLNQKDPAKVARVLGYQRYMALASARRMRALEAERTALGDVESRLEQAAARAGETRAARSALVGTLEDRAAARRKLVASLERRIGSNAARRKKLEVDEHRLQGVIQKVREEMARTRAARAKAEREKQAREKAQQQSRAAADSAEDVSVAAARAGPFKSRRGRLPWPAKGRLGNRYGVAREGGGLTWNGVLIRAREGAHIRAVHDGQVVFADWLRGFGQLLIIDHGGGYMSLYGYAADLLKSPGDLIRSGDAVATVGSSGGQSSAGVYFEIRHRGKPQNPSRWLARR